jgi:hypothetical protein
MRTSSEPMCTPARFSAPPGIGPDGSGPGGEGIRTVIGALGSRPNVANCTGSRFDSERGSTAAEPLDTVSSDDDSAKLGMRSGSVARCEGCFSSPCATSEEPFAGRGWPEDTRRSGSAKGIWKERSRTDSFVGSFTSSFGEEGSLPTSTVAGTLGVTFADCDSAKLGTRSGSVACCEIRLSASSVACEGPCASRDLPEDIGGSGSAKGIW